MEKKIETTIEGSGFRVQEFVTLSNAQVLFCAIKTTVTKQYVRAC